MSLESCKMRTWWNRLKMDRFLFFPRALQLWSQARGRLADGSKR